MSSNNYTPVQTMQQCANCLTFCIPTHTHPLCPSYQEAIVPQIGLRHTTLDDCQHASPTQRFLSLRTNLTEKLQYVKPPPGHWPVCSVSLHDSNAMHMIQNLLERFLRGPTYHTIYSCQHHSAHILWQTELLLMNIITITLGNLGAKQNKILKIMNLPQSWQIFQSWILDILLILCHFAIHSNDDDNASMMMTMRRMTMMIVMMTRRRKRGVQCG